MEEGARAAAPFKAHYLKQFFNPQVKVKGEHSERPSQAISIRPGGTRAAADWVCYRWKKFRGWAAANPGNRQNEIEEGGPHPKEPLTPQKRFFQGPQRQKMLPTPNRTS